MTILSTSKLNSGDKQAPPSDWQYLHPPMSTISYFVPDAMCTTLGFLKFSQTTPSPGDGSMVGSIEASGAVGTSAGGRVGGSGTWEGGGEEAEVWEGRGVDVGLGDAATTVLAPTAAHLPV